eukprot:7022170-Prymnesium_polylepis.1
MPSGTPGSGFVIVTVNSCGTSCFVVSSSSSSNTSLSPWIASAATRAATRRAACIRSVQTRATDGGSAAGHVGGSGAHRANGHPHQRDDAH